MKKYFLFLIVPIILSCNSINQEKLLGVWKLENIEDPNLTQLGEVIDNNFPDYMKNVTDNFLADSYINFYSNNNFTYKFGSLFIFGNWSYDKKSKSISLSTREKDDKESKMVFIVDKLINDKLFLKIRPNDNKSLKPIIDSLDRSNFNGLSEYFQNSNQISVYSKDIFEYKDKKQDIFALNNNSWRIKPVVPETNIQIKERLKGSIYYVIIFLNNSLLRKENSINIHSIFSPIKLAGNGIALKDKNDLPYEWIDIFYNQSQADEAYQLLLHAFNQDIKINNYETWVELDLDLINQIYDKIK